ncbi:STAS/SEC14 domain-containing protein [Herbiconiux sp. VKM Ac-1786]|uniref:STAS/SEC14 domain-containing protein n=1 Tax=Herbiconiux sp. VKM Ac-1786 TaxID=2783824 RepID=UPI00188A2A9C|nr:STAS/SEC14 domain-containing protein [Herbiconiux sp. VKM Ac-1786]MBF4574191.1 STAS/SEC14 domain-containing protein [Herbiconiux sp. VKM Ac-1786]
MLTGNQLPDTHIFEITYSGALTAGEFEALRDRLEAFLDANDPADLLAVYGDIDLGDIEPKALWEDLRSAGLEKKVRRAALLTDQGWLRTLAKTARHFIHADVEVFGTDERAEALAWLQR